MAAIRLQVKQVIDEVAARCAAAECRESDQGSRHRHRREEKVRGEKCNEHQQILQPVLRSQGAHIFTQAGTAVCKGTLGVCDPGHSSQQSRVRTDDNGFPGRGPHGKITRFIADVVETSFPQLLHETCSFALS